MIFDSRYGSIMVQAQKVEQQQETLTKLATDSTELEESLRDKSRELFRQDLEIEDKNREAQKNQKDHQDNVQYKEEIYSKYGNNQDRALKGTPWL